jgi:hypothetical protein
MKKRLCINIICDDKNIANVYYHQSGNIVSTLSLVNIITNYIVENKTSDVLLDAIRAIETTGAGFTVATIEDYLRIKYPDEKFIRFNSCISGIIEITETGMNKNRVTADNVINIDISKLDATVSL